MRWNQEEKYLKDEWSKFTTIKACLNEKEDIEAGKQLRTSDALLGHLTRRWGTMDRLIPNLILELQTLPQPKVKRDTKYASNLSKITSTWLLLNKKRLQEG